MKRCLAGLVISAGFIALAGNSPAETLLPRALCEEATPMLPTDWLAESVKKVTPQQANLLTRAQATLLGNMVSGDAWKPYRGFMPSLGTYRGIWNWDSAFHAVAVSHWDAELAREQFEIVFSKQLPNGELPDVIWENGTMVTSSTKPPVMAWAVAVVDRRSPTRSFSRKFIRSWLNSAASGSRSGVGQRTGCFITRGRMLALIRVGTTPFAGIADTGPRRAMTTVCGPSTSTVIWSCITAPWLI